MTQATPYPVDWSNPSAFERTEKLPSVGPSDIWPDVPPAENRFTTGKLVRFDNVISVCPAGVKHASLYT